MNNLNLSPNLPVRPRAGYFLACRGVALAAPKLGSEGGSARSRILFLLAGLLAASVAQAAGLAATNTPAVIPWNQIGAKAGANYEGDGLAVTPTGSGARLHCVFQRLDGEATPEGLWLTSTVTNSVKDRFRVTAAEVGRVTPCAPGQRAGEMRNLEAGGGAHGVTRPTMPLLAQGTVSIEGQSVRFTRPGLVEEYSVSMDGVRQDFIIEQPALNPQPSTLDPRAGELAVQLAVSGARIVPAPGGAQLVLENSGRKIAYSRLRVTDAGGKELPARIEVVERGEAVGDVESQRDSISRPRVASRRATLGQANTERTTLKGLYQDASPGHPQQYDATPLGLELISRSIPRVGAGRANPGLDGTIPSGLTGIGAELKAMPRSETRDGAHGVTRPTMLVVLVDDADAVYPVRIDPTFSDANWVSMGGFPGANGPVEAAVVDGSGNLYIGGEFTVAGNTIANKIAEWNGSSWSALGSGMNLGGYVSALAVSGSTLYAGGNFTTAGGSTANNIAQWNGTTWSPLGSGMVGEYGAFDAIVYALAVSGGTLYAGGSFTNAGGSAANGIAEWNGTTWSPLGSGMVGEYPAYNAIVFALAVSGGTLYAGGFFTTAGGSAATNIAQWNGTSWSPLGSGMNDWVRALAVSGSTLYAGGTFTNAGGMAASSIAQWNGTTWSPLGSGVSGGDGSGGPSVYALAVSGGTLYAGGDFTNAGGSAANDIAQWNGSSWSPLGSGMGGDNPYVLALAVSGSTLYAGGDFTTAGTNAANGIAQWNGSSWSGFGSGINGLNSDVYALAVSGGTLYAGGQFTTAGGSAANYIAQWNGSSWSALGSGLGPNYSSVYALAVSGGTLYAGGNFTTAGGVAANDIAQWNGSSWSALGSGMNYAVYAEAVSGSTLYVGGIFTTAGGSAANYIAQWNGSGWSALGSGLGPNHSSVNALAVSGGTLYAGGGFTNAGGSAANNIAQWNGTSWSALGSGMNSIVRALAVSGSTLYAGGGFTTAGGSAANSIAQWNGSSWSALGSGISGVGDNGLGPYVLALALSGDTLFAGGEFATAGGSAANSIAQWNGSSWSALGSGMSGGYGVAALAVSGSTLYAGGNFTTAGTNASANAAMAYLPVPAPPVFQAVTLTNGARILTWSTEAGGTYQLQYRRDWTSVNWINLGSPVIATGATLSFTDSSQVDPWRVYRVKLLP